MMHKDLLTLTPAERQRIEYRQFVVDDLHRTGEPLSDSAALVADVLADTPQSVMHTPRSLIARAYFTVHADEAGLPRFSPELLAEALEELASRGLLPSWCRIERTTSEVVAR